MTPAHDRPTAAPARRTVDRSRRGRPVALAASMLAMAGALAAWSPAPARAWGFFGHKMAGQIAADRLTPNARKAVAGLLDPGESLSGISTWADEVGRDKVKESASWHYVNVPIADAGYDKKYEDPKGGVVSKIHDFQAILSDPTRPRAERQEALRFLVHFVQDMHQPVHVGHRDDRGGNNLQLQFFDKGSNLHRVWDRDLIEHAGRKQDDYVRDLEGRITTELAERWSQGTVEDWANESHKAARSAYLVPGTDKQLKKGAKIGQPYYDANLPVAEQRIEQAGVRLAKVLNDIFP